MKKIIISTFFLLLFMSSSVQGRSWNRHKTPHYLILSQVSKHSTVYVGNIMEAVYREYSQRFTFRQNPQGRFVLKVFAKRKDLQSYLKSVGGSPTWQGAYIRKRRELVVSFELSRIDLRSLLFHEGFHQFLEYYISAPPVWFNEGLAEYFSKAVPLPTKKFKFGLPIIDHLKRLAKGYESNSIPPIGKVVTAPYRVFHNPSKEKDYYAQSWLLIHYLINQHKSKVNKIIRLSLQKKAINYYELFGHAKRLKKKLEKYLKHLLIESGQYLFVEGRKAFGKGDYDRAIRKFTMALTKNKYHSKARHFRGLIHFHKKNYPAAIRDFTKVIHMGHDWAATFYYRGVAQIHLGRRKEARFDLRVARRLDPQNPRILKALKKIEKK